MRILNVVPLKHHASASDMIRGSEYSSVDREILAQWAKLSPLLEVKRGRSVRQLPKRQWALSGTE